MKVVERKQIQSKLDAREKLARLSNEELLELSKNPSDFDYFVEGLAIGMNYGSVCYLYQYFGIIKEMINNNMDRMASNEEMSQNALYVLRYLTLYDKHDYKYKVDFSAQYKSLVASNLKLDKLGMDLNDLDKFAATMFSAISEGNIEDIQCDKYYVATVAYLSKYHPQYLQDCPSLMKIYDTIYNPNRHYFASKKDYNAFKKVALVVTNNMSRYSRETAKVKVKEPHGYKW